MRAALPVICLLCLAPVAFASTPEPSFFGVQGWRTPTSSELRSLERAGVGSVRVGFNLAPVVSGDGDRHWSELDDLVAEAARTEIDLLPVLVYAPHVRDAHRARPPRTPSARHRWAGWVEEAVERYGADGAFWSAAPEVPYRPVTAWQVWNEPNLREHWPRPSARSYLALLRSTSRAIRYSDPSATVVLAGIPSTFRGIRLGRYLRALYRQPRFKSLFDVIAMHPYARDVDGVERGVKLVRRIMRRFGDRDRHTWITEIGWATGGQYPSRFRVSVDGQAERLRNAFSMFIAERERWRIERVFWFSLRDRDLAAHEPDWFGPHTGLFYRSGFAKPAWHTLTTITGGVAGDWLDRPFGLD